MTTYLLHHLLTETSRKYPYREAVSYKNRFITYSELETRSNQLAALLLEQGVKKWDRIGILLNKSIESIVSLFGIMKAGAIYVPLDPLAPANRVNHIISHCDIKCLIASADNLRKLSETAIDSPLRTAVTIGSNGETYPGNIECVAWEKMESDISLSYRPVEPADTSPAYILHTSGSTGRPKGVVISHLNALTFVNMAADFFGLQHDDRVANHAPLHFDLSVFDIFGAIRAGASIVIVPESLSPFPAKLAEYIDHERISVWNSVASVLTMLADRGRLDRFEFERLRLVHFSGDIMPVKYLRILKQRMKHGVFYNIYGQTEANSSLFYRIGRVPDKEAWKIPIGKPFPNFEVFALNEVNEVINRPGEEGELYVKGSTVALGYWNDEQMSMEKFIADPRHPICATPVYKTADLVRVDEEGNYVFAGRKDHMIKSRGYRIELAEIELVLNSHPDVGHAIVLAIPDDLIGNRIIAYMALSEGAKLSAEDMAAYCHTLLPHYMVPGQIFFIERMPRTTTGKADRKLMTETYLNQNGNLPQS